MFAHLPQIDVAVQSTATMAWVPNPGPQTQAFLCEADELFYGGEAGGGKTDLGIGLAPTAHKRSLLLRRINKDAVMGIDQPKTANGNKFSACVGTPDRVVDLQSVG